MSFRAPSSAAVQPVVSTTVLHTEQEVQDAAKELARIDIPATTKKKNHVASSSAGMVVSKTAINVDDMLIGVEQTEAAATNTTKTVSSFGFKKGFLNTNVSSSSSSTTAKATAVTAVLRPNPGRVECPICLHGLPINIEEHVYHTCCGQVICSGCMIGKQRTQLKELGKIDEGTTPEEEQFRLIHDHGMDISVCPYCRTAPYEGDEECLQRLYDRIKIRNDRDYVVALNQLGYFYENGMRGLPQNRTKAEELYKKAYDLDEPEAAWKLFHLYHDHYPDQIETARKYLVRGELLGHVYCTQVLAIKAKHSGDKEEFARLCVKSVRLGGVPGGDINNLLNCYRLNLLSKDDLAATLRAYQAVKNEVETERRDFAQRFVEFRRRNFDTRTWH